MIHDLLHRFGYEAVFVLLALEAAGLPLPGETVMMAAALYAAHSHALAIGPLYACACAGAILGGAGGWEIGRRVGLPLLHRHGPRFGFNADRQLLAQYLMQKNGPALVFFARYIAVLRSAAGLLAGATGMGWRQFMLFNALGGAVWTALYCIGVYALGSVVMRMAGGAAIVLTVLLVAALTVGFVFLRRNEARLTRLARQALAPNGAVAGAAGGRLVGGDGIEPPTLSV